MRTADLIEIDPTAGSAKGRVALARRPEDLAGKVVALLDNTKEQSDIIMDAMAAALTEKYGVARVITHRKPHYSKFAPEELIEEIAREADAAIAGLGG
jgi:predicted GTPase